MLEARVCLLQPSSSIHQERAVFSQLCAAVLTYLSCSATGSKELYPCDGNAQDRPAQRSFSGLKLLRCESTDQVPGTAQALIMAQALGCPGIHDA